jgi:hypothetical protein
VAAPGPSAPAPELRFFRPRKILQYAPAAEWQTFEESDWLLEQGGFEPSSPFIPRSFGDLVGMWIFLEKNRVMPAAAESIFQLK